MHNMTQTKPTLPLRRHFVILWLTALLGLSATTIEAAPEDEKIKSLIHAYTQALSHADVEAVVSLYTPDGVFLPSAQPSANGTQQIRAAYTHEFALLDLDVAPVFDEIFQQGDFAYVRTRSAGRLTVKAQNRNVSTGNYRALFILQKYQDEWRIARFMFNFTDNAH